MSFDLTPENIMTEMLAVITITIFAVISPGPDFAMVSRNSLILSRRAGLLTAFGIGLGVLVHVSYTLLGIGLVIKQSPWLFNIIKMAGATYLIWLGIKMLRSKANGLVTDGSVSPLSDLEALRTGFLTNVLNPKTTVFIVSIFVQVIKPETEIAMEIGYGIFISMAHIIWFSIVGLCFSAEKIRHSLLALSHWTDRAFGSLLLAFGMLLFVATQTN